MLGYRIERDELGNPSSLTFRFPVWQSKKNDTRPGRGTIRSGIRSRRHAEAIRLFLAGVTVGREGPLFGSDDVSITMRHAFVDDTVEVVVRRLGAAAVVDGKTGRRRDLLNLWDTLCDALQGIAYNNDNQIASGDARRIAHHDGQHA